jgi:aminopeptidase-like protein
MRSKYGEYPEYHTSDDNFEKVVTKNGLFGSYLLIIKAIEAIQNNCFPKSLIKCEPFLSRYNLYTPFNKKYCHNHKFKSSLTDPLYNLISHSDGRTSLIEIAEKILVPVWELYNIINLLRKKNIIKI